MKAIRIHETGGPEVLKYEDTTVPVPGEGEVLVKIAAAGINFIDVYHRTGVYPMPLPFTPGLEAAGIVEAVGGNTSLFSIGDKVAYSSQLGSYAEYVAISEEKLVPIPKNLSMENAAAAMLQGMTAHYLAFSTYPLKKGETTLIHAAAGGVGRLLVQMAKRAGATVIGTVSTEEKAELAKNAGADHIIFYNQTDFETETKRITDGHGVDVVYDSVGLATFDKSLNVLRPRGHMVLFGQSSGVVPPFNLGLLNQKGSLYITRPSLFHYISNREDLLWRTREIFSWIEDGSLVLRIDRSLPLAEAGKGQTLLTSRKTAGKVLLLP